MAIQTINIGTTANDGTGDDPRTAGSKINDNFTDSTHAASRDVGTTAGNIMEVGAFGLGKPGVIVADLDDEVFSQFSRTAATTLNIPGPVANGGSCVTFGYDINASRQIYSYPQSNSVWTRRKGSVTWQSWYEFLHTLNTTVDGSGFIKSASPIVKLYSDKIELNDYKELEYCTFERVETGHYIIKGAPQLSRDGWYIETLKDRNNNIYFTLDYEELEDGLHIKTYEPDYSTGRATNGEPVDINEGRFVTLRFEEDKAEE